MILVWSITAEGKDKISSPVKHGTVPEGAVLEENIQDQLVNGVRYEVYIVRENGDSGRISFTAGQ